MTKRHVPARGTVFYALMNALTVIPNEVRDLLKRMPQIITGKALIMTTRLPARRGDNVAFLFADYYGQSPHNDNKAPSGSG